MKIKYKLALVIFSVGIVFLAVAFLSSYRIQRMQRLASVTENYEHIINHEARHLDSLLREKVKTVRTLAETPLVKSAALSSSQNYVEYDEAERGEQLEKRNTQWRATNSFDDPFIASFLENSTARYFETIAVALEGDIGEIFLTNRYGAVVAATKKLTTFTHAHKYWWRACFSGGRNSVFLDDRGYDESVEGCVLGVVVPVLSNNRFAGILKCNIRIDSFMNEITSGFAGISQGVLQIVRTKGRVLYEEGSEPLAETVSPFIVEKMRNEDFTPFIHKNELFVIKPVPITFGNNEIFFGGSEDSIDHILGNSGESWVFVYRRPLGDVFSSMRSYFISSIVLGLLLTALLALTALYLGRRLTQSITSLTGYIGNISSEAESHFPVIRSNDEIRVLADSMQSTLKDLTETTISRDRYAEEVDRRRRAEEQLRKALNQKELLLKEINHRVKNNLGLITSIINIKRMNSDNTHVTEVLQEVTSKISSISLLHEMLYKTSEFEEINARDYINDLSEKLISTISYSPVERTLDVDEVYFRPKEIVSIGLIVAELITNAVKHGIGGTGGDIISVSLKKTVNDQEQDAIVLRVWNNGAPISQQFDLHNLDSLGLSMVTTLAEQLDGELHIERADGTAFVITFPLTPQ